MASPITSGPRVVDIVPHTHWDREWYAPFQRFRARLVEPVEKGTADDLPADGLEPLAGGRVCVDDPHVPGLDDRQRDAVEALTKGLVAKLLHQPTVTLKDTAGSATGEATATCGCGESFNV